MFIGFADDAKAGGGLLANIVAIVSALAWPILILVVLIWFRKPISALAKAAVGIAETASKVKIWEIEFDRNLGQQLEKTAQEAEKAPLMIANPRSVESAALSSQAEAASQVNNFIAQAPTSALKTSALDSVRDRMIALAQEYDATRSNMPHGKERTRAMNVVAAKMRTLGLAAAPFLEEFSRDQLSPGKRLAAICILQMQPDLRYIPWLCDRMGMEQPFIFYHASLALLNAVRKYGADSREELHRTIQQALDKVNSFSGEPDQNTVQTLTLALLTLES